jgi:hypothetical protein
VQLPLDEWSAWRPHDIAVVWLISEPTCMPMPEIRSAVETSVQWSGRREGPTVTTNRRFQKPHHVRIVERSPELAQLHINGDAEEELGNVHLPHIPSGTLMPDYLASTGWSLLAQL